MSATIEKRSITFSDFPLEAHTQKAQEESSVFPLSVRDKISSTSSHGSALDFLLGRRRRVQAVLFAEVDYGHGQICVGRPSEIRDGMAKLEGFCETDSEASKVWVALKRCSDFVRWRAEVDLRRAGETAA